MRLTTLAFATLVAAVDLNLTTSGGYFATLAMVITKKKRIKMAMTTRAIAEELSKERGKLPEGSDKSDYDLAHMKRICESYSGKQVN